MAAVTATIPTRRITARLDLPHLAALHSPRLPLFLIGRWLLTWLAALLRLPRLLLTVVTLLLITLALPSCLRRFATTRRVPATAGAVIVCLRA